MTEPPDPPTVEPHGEGDAPHGYRWVRRFINFVPSEAGIKIVNVKILVPTNVRVAGKHPRLEGE